jgi:outer membrane protein insertion porin family
LKRLRVLRLFLLLLSSTVTLIFSQNEIKKIDIYGNSNVSEERILLLMKTKPGGEFNKEVMKEDIKSLVETGFFSRIRYETEDEKEGIIVKIYLTENPVIRNVQFTGNRVFKEKQLMDFLGVGTGEILNETKVIEGIEKIKTKYQDKRFYLVEVNYEIKEAEKEGVSLIISIKEEGRGYVRNLIFEGNSSFPSYRLRKLMKVKQRKMPFLRGTFKKDVFERDIERLKAFYKENGFLNIKIENNITSDKKDGLLIITITIQEGKQYHLGSLKFKGETILKEQEIINILSLKEKGQVFNRKQADENIKNLTSYYMDKGYLRIGVEEIPVEGEEPDVIDLTYYIEPGEIYHAGEIIVRGNTKTKDKVIRREVKIEPGDKITSNRLQKSFNNLFDLNYFEKINIYPEFKDVDNTANVVVDVEEKQKTGIFLIGGGYSSVDDIMGVISIQQTNFDISNPPSFTGGGQNLTFTTEIGTETQNFSVSFTEPYFLDKPVWLGTDLYRMSRSRSGYTDERTGGALRIGRRWDKTSLGFTMRVEEITLSEIDIPSVAGQEGDNRKNSLTTSFTYNALDRRRDSTKGILSRLSLEYAGDLLQGDIDFIKPLFENDFYFPMKKLVFRSKTLAGSIKEIEDTDEIPIYERFFGGGIGTVRGYEERSLGPRDSLTDDPVGGQSLFAQNFELIYPLYQDILKGVLFFDIGNVWEDWSEWGSLRKSVGAGIKVIIPMFNAPIEIYYGHALDREPGDSEGRWHFGMSFGF